MAALDRLDYPSERWERIVVDDAELGLGPGGARNHGAARAIGQYLAFTDDDCEPEPGWLAALADGFARDPGAMLGGRTANALPGNPFSAASQRVTDLVYAHYNADPAGARFFASNNMALPREAFAALGGFDDRFSFASEDRDLCDRWRLGGGEMVWRREAVVHHRHELDLLGFCRQHFAYGRGAARFHAARAGRRSGRMVDEMSFHLDRRLWRAGLGAGPAQAALLGLWQVCNALGFAWQRAT